MKINIFYRMNAETNAPSTVSEDKINPEVKKGLKDYLSKNPEVSYDIKKSFNILIRSLTEDSGNKFEKMNISQVSTELGAIMERTKTYTENPKGIPLEVLELILKGLEPGLKWLEKKGNEGVAQDPEMQEYKARTKLFASYVDAVRNIKAERAEFLSKNGIPDYKAAFTGGLNPIGNDNGIYSLNSTNEPELKKFSGNSIKSSESFGVN